MKTQLMLAACALFVTIALLFVAHAQGYPVLSGSSSGYVEVVDRR